MQPRLNDRPLARSPTKKTFAIPGSASQFSPALGGTCFPQLSSCSNRSLRQRSAGNNRLSGAKNGDPATGNDRKELPPVQLPKNTGFTSGSADDKPLHNAPGSTSAQRPDARRYESTARATFASAPVFPPNRPGNSRERLLSLQKAGMSCTSSLIQFYL